MAPQHAPASLDHQHAASAGNAPHAAHTAPGAVDGGVGAGVIPQVKPMLAMGDHPSASERGYGGGRDPGKNHRSRLELGPEEKGSFGQPYASSAEAFAAEAFLRAVLLPGVLAKFGPDVLGLWLAYLSRRPGDSLEPRVFAGDSPVANAFRRTSETRTTQKSLLNKTQDILRKDWDAQVATLPLGATVRAPLTSFVPEPTLPWMSFVDPHTIPGHIAGGIGSSDAGPDTREVTGSVRLRRIADDTVIIEPELRFTVRDAIDFIPGDMGTPMESIFTIPLSRLEASGWAYDVPFVVDYHGPVDSVELVRGVDASAFANRRSAEPDWADKVRRNPGLIPDPAKPAP